MYYNRFILSTLAALLVTTSSVNAGWFFSGDTKETSKSAAHKAGRDTKSNFFGATDTIGDKASDAYETARDASYDAANSISSKASQAKDRAQHRAAQAKRASDQKASEARSRVEHRSSEARNKAERTAQEARQRTETAASEAKDRASKMWGAAKGEYSHPSVSMRVKHFFERITGTH